jgi:AbrB family looped-hinge helix DNA binding protein
MADEVLLPKIVTVTSKLQITIPKRFRREHGLHPGSKVSLEVKSGRLLITPYPAQEVGTA